MKNLVEKLITPNLMLRILDKPDAAEVQELLARNKNYMTPWIPWAGQEPQTVAEKEDKIRHWKGKFYLDESYVYGIFDKAGHQLIGLGFMFSRQGRGTLEIGYIIDENEAGKGYGTESTYALTKLGFQYLMIEKMLIICSRKNTASAKIPEKLGYILEYLRKSIKKSEDGSRSEDMIWAMFIEDFQEKEKYEPVRFL